MKEGNKEKVEQLAKKHILRGKAIKAVSILVGLGVDELSMNPADIPRVKAMIREIDPGRAKRLAEEALTRASAAEVRQLLGY